MIFYSKTLYSLLFGFSLFIFIIFNFVLRYFNYCFFMMSDNVEDSKGTALRPNLLNFTAQTHTHRLNILPQNLTLLLTICRQCYTYAVCNLLVEHFWNSNYTNLFPYFSYKLISRDICVWFQE